MKKAAAKSKAPGPTTAADRALVDELAVLEKELAEHAAAAEPKEIRAAQLRCIILAWFDDADASTSFVAEGEKSAYKVGERSLKRTVLYDKAVKLLGKELLLKIATIQLGALQKAAVSKYERCITSARTGPRSLTRVGD